MQKWYYLVDDGEIIGPFAAEEMIDLYKGEKIHRETYVWNEELEEWLYFRDSSLYNEELEKIAEEQSSENERVQNNQGDREAPASVSFRELFSEVPQKHPKVDEGGFFAGSMSGRDLFEASLPKPWVFSRILFVMILTGIVLFSMAYLFYLPQFLPGILMISAFAVPFAIVVFFWELNVPKTLRLFDLGHTFFVGSLIILVFMQILYRWFPLGEGGVPGAVLIAILMALGKLAIISAFLFRWNTRYYLNGLLIGATVGAAFAVFETTGHALHSYASGGYGEILDTLLLHGWSAVGSHPIWGAIIGGALVFVKGNESLGKEHFIHPDFLKLFAVVMVLHAAWNIFLLFDYYALPLIVLSVIAWVFIFRGIQQGLGEIKPSGSQTRGM
ncbi:PrsW family glutamic-type intramembrane protease [Salicibibacter kimchii]|uniref:DUF4339 domain-containing protein n=1 Tax=Salicibibacter kimchii TaxID=2099786 RepID=A0A345BX84_9BACI|nr:GYF domain-containing protein [Salicibibacter kimchii]AXF55565.1 DUF4339 domain-containing protein [Salicibibacter kimchii]